ncbi:MAG: SCO family protein, partial [bacterium]
LDNYSGNYVFISFIFTRCPVPNMCPAVVIKNGVIARNFKDYDNVKLVMVSFDYLYDTPEILKSFYGSSTEDFPNWDVLSSVGKVSDLYTLSSEIGCEYWGIEKNNIGHNLRSALIGPDKTLLKIWEGDDWLAGSVSKEIENYIKFAQ